MSKSTQAQRVLEYIEQFGSITQIDAIQDLGVMRFDPDTLERDIEAEDKLRKELKERD